MDSLTNAKVLIIDDDRTVLLLIQKFISKFGYEIFIETNSKLALQKIKDIQPDLIILDMEMPDLSGLDLLKLIQKEDTLKTIPVIFLSANEKVSAKILAFDSGAADYLVKPVHLRELEIRIKTQIRIAEDQRKIAAYVKKMEELANERAAQLMHADRLATLGTLAAGVAHEINNPATFISGNIQVLKTYFDFSMPLLKEASDISGTASKYKAIVQEVPKIFAEMSEGIARISQIVMALTAYSRKDDSLDEIFDLKKIDTRCPDFYPKGNQAYHIGRRPSRITGLYSWKLPPNHTGFDQFADQFGRCPGKKRIPRDRYSN